MQQTPHIKQSFGLRVLRTPVRAPKANAYCERLVGTVRRECLDFIIPLNERHLRMTLRSWVTHYNKGRPHSSLGPGIPEKALDTSLRTTQDTPAQIATGMQDQREANSRRLTSRILAGSKRRVNNRKFLRRTGFERYRLWVEKVIEMAGEI